MSFAFPVLNSGTNDAIMRNLSANKFRFYINFINERAGSGRFSIYSGKVALHCGVKFWTEENSDFILITFTCTLLTFICFFFSLSAYLFSLIQFFPYCEIYHGLQIQFRSSFQLTRHFEQVYWFQLKVQILRKSQKWIRVWHLVYFFCQLKSFESFRHSLTSPL